MPSTLNYIISLNLPMNDSIDYTMFDNAPVPIGICSLSGDFLYLNQSFISLFGYQLSDIPNLKYWFERAYPFESYRDKVMATWEVDQRITLDTGKNQPAREFVITTKFAEIKTVETSFNIDEKKVFLYFNDVSRRKRAELKIRESEERFRQLFHLTFEGIFIHFKGVAIDMNIAFANIFGYDRKELIGQNIIEMVGSKNLKPLFYQKNEETESGPYLGEAYKKNGETIIIELEGRNVNYNGNYLRVTAVRNVTEKIKAEEALIKEKIFTERLINVLPGVFYLYKKIDNEFQLIRWNKNHEKYTGYKADELRGHQASWFIAPTDHGNLFKSLKEVENVGSTSLNAKIKHKNNRLTPFHFEAHQIIDGGDTYFLGVGFDITDQIRAEKEIQESQAQLNAIYKNAPVTLMLVNNNIEIIKVNTTSFISEANNINPPLKFGDFFRCQNAVNSEEGCGTTQFCRNCHVRQIMTDTFKKNINANKIESEISVYQGNSYTNKTILVSTVKLKEIQPELVLITIDDITLRKDIERKMRENERKFRNIFDSSKNGIIITDPVNQILNFNLTSQQIFNDLNLAEGKHFEDLFRSKDQILIDQYLSEISIGNIPSPIEVGLIQNNEKVLEISSKIIDYEDKKALLNTIRDITIRKQLEQKELQTIIQTEEKERSRIARELHDGIGPLLSTTKIYMDAISSSNDENRSKIAFERLSQTIEEAIKSVQEISNNVSPHVLQNFGLEKALQSFISKLIGLTKIEFHFNSNLPGRLQSNIEITLYRVLVELTNNSLKYSDATLITIKIHCENDILLINYTDNGKGFDLKKTLSEAKGMGLSNIYSRIGSINGHIEMDTAHLKGIHVTIQLNVKTLWEK